MPRRNHTGPKGKGPMTGKKMGYCGQGKKRNFDGKGRKYENPFLTEKNNIDDYGTKNHNKNNKSDI